MQKLGTATAAVRQVSYFRGLSPQDIYATYSKTAIQNSNDNFVINITQSFPSIISSTDKLGVLLMQAKAVNVVNGPLLYDSALREDTTWHYLTAYARTRSCQQVLSMVANATDKEQHYSEFARLLQRDGPCAPSFEGFDVLQNPSDVEFSGTDYSSGRVLIVARAQNTGRDALMAVTRKYVGVTLPETLMVPVNENTSVPQHQRLFAATAIFDSPAGPPGSKGAVTFDQGFSQYIDGGTHTFNNATNGGFTIVSVVKFSGAAAMGERIIDFGKGTDNDNVIIYRYGDDKMLLSIRNGITQCFIFTEAVIVQNTWLTVVATYASSSRNMKL